MTNNEYYKCDACGTTLRLRYQVGYSNIPVSIYCPKCNCHIEGKIFIDNNNSRINSSLIGASKTKINSDFADYVVELSTEFLVRKCLNDSEDNIYFPTMFIRSNPLDAKRNRRRSSLIEISNNHLAYSNVFENLFILLHNNQIKLLKNYVKNISDFFSDDLKRIDFNCVENKLDAMLATKHFINILIMPLMADGVFNKIYDIMNVKMKRIVSNHSKGLIEFLGYLDDDYFDTYLSKIPAFIIDYLECVGQLIPVYDCYNNFGSIDLTMYGISTMSIDNMAVIYKKGYEIICDSIDLLVGLFNIENNGSFDNFVGKGVCEFSQKMSNYVSKYKKYEEVTNNNSDLFDGIRDVLDNVIRNAEGHNSIEIDGMNQIITFINRNRGCINSHKLSFLEFGKRCIDIFSAVLYIWEFYYQCAKLKSVLIDGVKLNYGVQR